MANEPKWTDPGTVIALVQIGLNAAPSIIALFKKNENTQKLEPITLEGLLALGFSLDEATLMLIEAAQNQP